MVKGRKPLLKGLGSLANSTFLKKIVKENRRSKKVLSDDKLVLQLEEFFR